MPLDPVLADEVRGWLRKADTDLRSADADLAVEPPIPEDVLFHSQQAVEKAIKAYLTLCQIPFRKTHDLRVLVKACAAVDKTLEAELADAVPLTAYAWRFRYPGVEDEADLDEARAALRTARGAVAAIRKRIPREAGGTQPAA